MGRGNVDPHLGVVESEGNSRLWVGLEGLRGFSGFSCEVLQG